MNAQNAETNSNAQQDRIISIVGLIVLAISLFFVYRYAQNYTPANAARINALLGGIITIGIYTVLYRENPIYRFIEHVFIGLGVGYSLAATWSIVLRPKWYDPIFAQGQWMWLWMLPLAIMAYFVFSRKHGWISRIPLGILIGLSAGQIFEAFWSQYAEQIGDSFKPLVPNSMNFASGSAVPPGPNVITIDRAFNNIVFTVTLLSVLTYFFFAFEQKNKGVKNFAQLGRWLIMIGFGAIFGSTIMQRFALLVDRMSYVLREWLHWGV